MDNKPAVLDPKTNHDDHQTNEHQIRVKKQQQWRASHQAYRNDRRPTHTIHKLRQQFAQTSKEDLTQLDASFAVVGRMMVHRIMGKAAFADLHDTSGRLQIYFKQQHLGAERFEECTHFDRGDWLWIQGHLFITKTDELTLYADDYCLLAKCLHPLPDKFHGMKDPDLRFRQRYLDIMMDRSVQQRFVQRSTIISSLRQHLQKKGFLEVETPMMHPVAGGAMAKPFVTHHHALHRQLYLRIAPELYLKRLLIAGYDKVFEINRNFRNEGLSTRHNPEFTMLEFYQTFADVYQALDATETLLKSVFSQLDVSLPATYQQHPIDFYQPFQRRSMVALVQEALPHSDPWSVDSLKQELAGLYSAEFGQETDWGKWLVLAFEEKVEKLLIQPTFVIDYPASISPLAKPHASDNRLAERFELFIAGQEIANGFSELNDPDLQKQYFLQQLAQRNQGDEEAMSMDEDFLLALEYGMPPAAGVGIGIDRLVMLITNCASIREVICFPHLRAKE